MRRWFEAFPSVLRAPDDDHGSDTVRVVDPGAERELDDPDDPATTATPKKDDPAEQLRKELADERKKREDAEADAKFWSDRARRQPPSAAPAPARTEPEPEPERRRQPEIPAEKPEDLIDDLNKRGLVALKDRGYITKDDLQEALDAAATRTQADISEARSEAEFSGRLASEFPEMMEDSARAAKGLAPKSELFVVAGQIYRDYVDLDPNLKGSRGLLLIAARQAKAQIEGRGKGGPGRSKAAPADDPDLPPSQRRRAPADDDQARRRDRIDRQRHDRGADDVEDRGEGDQMTPEAREIAKRLKVSPEQFHKESEKLRAGGGGRRGRN